MPDYERAVRLPVRYSVGGADALAEFKARYELTDPTFYKKVDKELREGFPIEGAIVHVFADGTHRWDILHPDVDVDIATGFDIDTEPVDLPAVGLAVFGHREYCYTTEMAAFPSSLFVCTHVQDIGLEFRADILDGL